MKKRSILYIIGILLLIGAITTAVYIYQSNNTSVSTTTPKQEVLATTDQAAVSYQGKNGETALALLEKAAKIQTSGTGEMAYVTTINGVTADSKSEYWQFNINGASSSVGAGSYITNDGDTITWKLVKF